MLADIQPLGAVTAIWSNDIDKGSVNDNRFIASLLEAINLTEGDLFATSEAWSITGNSFGNGHVVKLNGGTSGTIIGPDQGNVVVQDHGFNNFILSN